MVFVRVHMRRLDIIAFKCSIEYMAWVGISIVSSTFTPFNCIWIVHILQLSLKCSHVTIVSEMFTSYNCLWNVHTLQLSLECPHLIIVSGTLIPYNCLWNVHKLQLSPVRSHLTIVSGMSTRYNCLWNFLLGKNCHQFVRMLLFDLRSPCDFYNVLHYVTMCYNVSTHV